MTYIYAQIHAGIVSNTVLADSDNDIFSGKSDFVRIDQMNPIPQIGWKYNGTTFSLPDPMPLYDLIYSKIEGYRKVAPALLLDLYTQNTLAGITTAQSDQMFDDFDDVLLRIREGAFPTALYRLLQKAPIGYVTQNLLDSWATKIKTYL